MIGEQEKVYDTAGGLRDHAALNEKAAWNTIRSLARETSSVLRKLDDSLSDGRAAMIIGREKEMDT